MRNQPTGWRVYPRYNGRKDSRRYRQSDLRYDFTTKLRRLFRDTGFRALLAASVFALGTGLWSFSRSTSTTTPRIVSYVHNCATARAMGIAPIYRGQPGYAAHLDRDNDGIACERYR